MPAKKKSAQVRATASAVVGVGEDRVAVRVGQIFDESDDVVKAHPEMFERAGVPVEQATAAPGELRDR